MPDNKIYDPFLNPVKFYDLSLTNDDAFFTKHFDEYQFAQRLLEWQDPEDFTQIWQTTDTIYLQFESEFDPITIDLMNPAGDILITLPAIVGLPNMFYPNTRSYEIAMSLAGLDTGCYRLRRTRGSGEDAVEDFTPWMYISDTPFTFPTLLVKYWHSRAREGVMFETGIKFQVRIPGHIGRLKTGRDEERYTDQRRNPAILSSRPFRTFPVVFGDEFGLPPDMEDLLARIWGCDNVELDDKPFAAISPEFEYITAGDDDRYPKYGIKLQVAEGNNRASKILSQTLNANKKLTYAIMVEGKMWGDLSNSGSSNTVPILTVE